MAESNEAAAMTRESLLSRATAFYADSSDANGLPVSTLVREGADAEQLLALVTELVHDGELEVVWYETDENPHIRRLPRNFRVPFDELVKRCSFEYACLYPSTSVIAQELDLSRWNNEPYTRQLWEGGAHLDLVFFELVVLERYRNDPRFGYEQSYFGGSLNVKDKHYLSEDFPERDKVHVQRFGIGYDEKKNWVLGVILSDLRGLSAEHQAIWKAHQRYDKCKLNEASFAAWFSGEWVDFISIFEALTEELEVINQMTKSATGKTLFKSVFGTPPKTYGPLLRPTHREFQNFARALDLMLSENIDKNFFPSKVARVTVKTRRDGTEYEEPKGTIVLLEEWVRTSYRVEGDPAKEVGAGFREVRKLRSKASHTESDDDFDVKYEDEQRQLMKKVYESVRTLRLILSTHPAAKGVEVSDSLIKGLIRSP